MYRLSTACLLALVAACATVDSVHPVKGEAPRTGDCEIAVSETGTARVIRKEKVQGSFSMSFTSSGPFPPNVDVAAYCNGAKVKELKSIAPRNLREIDLGKLAP